MKNYTEFQKRVLPRLRQQFPPRLQRDLAKFPFNHEGYADIFENVKQGGGVFISGDTDTGKTVRVCQLAESIAFHHYMENKKTDFLFISCNDLFHKLRATIGKEETPDNIITPLLKTSLLILDDMAVDKLTPFVYQLLYYIINTRYEQLLPILYTSNLDLSQMEKVFGDSRITSRIDRTCISIHKSKY